MSSIIEKFALTARVSFQRNHVLIVLVALLPAHYSGFSASDMTLPEFSLTPVFFAGSDLLPNFSLYAVFQTGGFLGRG